MVILKIKLKSIKKPLIFELNSTILVDSFFNSINREGIKFVTIGSHFIFNKEDFLWATYEIEEKRK